MARTTNHPGDDIKALVAAINASRAKLEEALAEIAEYSARLSAVTGDVSRRLLTRD